MSKTSDFDPYHSQHGEDLWICKNIPLPSIGTFIEVGAFDGILSSNTLCFEQRGWGGFCVEPDLETGAKCTMNRKGRTYHCAVGSHPGKGILYVNKEDHGLSGLQRLGEPHEVVIRRLDDLIHESGIGHINLLSIDTEGTELDAWNSIGDHRPDIVIMEHNTLGLPSNLDRILERMIQDGYKEVHRTDCNSIFTR